MDSRNSCTFTDDDLKRLQKQLNDGFIFDQDTYDFKALLARLEAAEAICNHAWDAGLFPQFDERWKAWHKSKVAGK